MLYGNSAVNYYTSINYTNDRISVPVAPSQYIYSHFKHVSGVPAEEGSEGVSISRLKILDVLIDQLAQMKKNPEMKIQTPNMMSDKQIDALIDQFETQIRTATAAKAVMPYTPAPSAPPAALFSLSA